MWDSGISEAGGLIQFMYVWFHANRKATAEEPEETSAIVSLVCYKHIVAGRNM